MADKLITPKFRGAFVSVFRATVPRGAAPGQKPKYSVRAAFPPDTDLSQLKAAAAAIAKEKWGANIPKALRSPFRKNEELDTPVPGIGDDWIIMTFSSSEDRKVGVVDKNRQDIIDEADVYSGAWYRAQISGYAYEQQGNKGVSFGLENLQKLADDEPLGGGRMPASKAFEGFGDEEAKSAGDLFD